MRIELQEETGYELISPLQFLGRFFSSPGFTDEQQLVFRAKTKKGSHTPGDDAHRICSIEEMEIKKMKRMIANGEITDAKTLAAFTLLSANAQK